jgi:hypothetical protein
MGRYRNSVFGLIFDVNVLEAGADTQGTFCFLYLLVKQIITRGYKRQSLHDLPHYLTYTIYNNTSSNASPPLTGSVASQNIPTPQTILTPRYIPGSWETPSPVL